MTDGTGQNNDTDVVPFLRDVLGPASRLAGMEDFLSRVRVKWNPRLRSTAGRAWYPDCLIEINPRLVEFGHDEIRRTLLHELAHLVAYHRAGRRRIAAHGAEWKQACSDLGIPGERSSHHLPLPTHTQRKKYFYACPACGEGFKRVRRYKKQVACWPCCRLYAKGQFDARFRLVESRIY